jgi:dienelactone hydrolase
LVVPSTESNLMRTFEALLILVNVLSLIPAFRTPSNRVWLGAAGVNLLVFLLHSVFEGLRYQMAFSYLFVILFVGYALVKSNKGFRIKLPTALKVITLFLLFVSLGFTALLAYALPVFTLPKPTGTFDVGITYVHFVDESRTDPFIDTSTKNRELMVKIYYPATQDDSKPFAPYFHNTPALVRLFTTHFGLPDFMFDHLNLVKSHAKEGLLLSDGQQRYPVILFSHGAGTTMEVQTSQGEDLASHGYIVMAIDHPYVSVATVFPDRIVSAREATTDFNTADPAEIITQIMADDASFIIDELEKTNLNPDLSMFQGKFDLENIGVIGHSVGGAVAYNLAINDSRVKAAINLDGSVFVAPNNGVEAVAPFLMLANDQYHVQAIQARSVLMQAFETLPAEEQAMMLSMYGSEAVYRAAYDKAQQNMMGLTEVLERSGGLFTIEGSDHMKFIDIGLFIGVGSLRELIGIRGTIEPAKCLDITQAVTVAFFDHHLKGASLTSLESLVQRYPELINVSISERP